MKIFISWSGETSHKIALILRDWLPTILEGIEPWVSSEDINKGSRWGLELATKLEESSFGIICVDPSNINSPWLNFEAGALSKSVNNSSIVPFLFGFTPADLKGPLSQFQVVTYDKEDMRKLVRVIAKSSSANQPSLEKIDKLFDYTWHGLKEALDKLNTNVEKAEALLSKSISNQSVIHPISSENKLEEAAANILLCIVKRNINAGYSIDEISKSLNLPYAKVEYYFESFSEDGWFKKVAGAAYPWVVSNKKAVMDYLIRNGLI